MVIVMRGMMPPLVCDAGDASASGASGQGLFVFMARRNARENATARKRQAKRVMQLVFMGSCAHTALFMGANLFKHLANSEANGCPVAYVLMQIDKGVAVHFAHPVKLFIIGKVFVLPKGNAFKV